MSFVYILPAYIFSILYSLGLILFGELEDDS